MTGDKFKYARGLIFEGMEVIRSVCRHHYDSHMEELDDIGKMIWASLKTDIAPVQKGEDGRIVVPHFSDLCLVDGGGDWRLLCWNDKIDVTEVAALPDYEFLVKTGEAIEESRERAYKDVRGILSKPSSIPMYEGEHTFTHVFKFRQGHDKNPRFIKPQERIELNGR